MILIFGIILKWSVEVVVVTNKKMQVYKNNINACGVSQLKNKRSPIKLVGLFYVPDLDVFIANTGWFDHWGKIYGIRLNSSHEKLSTDYEGS